MPGLPHAQLNGGLTKRQRIDKAATDSKRSKALIGLMGHGPMKRKALWVPLWALWALGSLKGAPLCVGAKSVMGISVGVSLGSTIGFALGVTVSIALAAAVCVMHASSQGQVHLGEVQKV